MSAHFGGDYMASLTPKQLLSYYAQMQQKVMVAVQAASSSISSAQPGKFLMLQFMMSAVSQVGQSISNLLSQVQSMIMNSVRNQTKAG
jgi:hypothetical protein